MLRLTIAEEEFYNESKDEFFTLPELQLDLEHSLLSVSKWESEFEKPFLSTADRSSEEVLRYAYYMITTPEISPEVISRLTNQDLKKINDYIEKKNTATTFSDTKKHGGRTETITAELVYYWMVAFQIPIECEAWNLNRLFALIRICNMKNQPQKKMSRHEIAQRNRELNAQRRAELGTKG